MSAAKHLLLLQLMPCIALPTHIQLQGTKGGSSSKGCRTCSIGVDKVSAAGGILPQQRQGGLPGAVLRLLVQQQQAVPHKAAAK
jgi:hypothetical protein